eukprot:CAMPEP_0202700734 /NCGR_PEP_ID=MMETSP1385-20130828/13908_1 /ASSEMBLY_ACC=CAM_ASM_000861 /TAXON_ID=933848 /ORGANISM="Elphidium margaritaceum" /LENGTH=129 /DNA_ID=CAMNT_0049357991 /DNA_START=77 /DNA_END=463 /DNA_ORIENTATION=-
MPPPIPAGFKTHKYCPALRRHMLRRTRDKRIGYPEPWKGSKRPLRQLWNLYYTKTSYRLYKECMNCTTWEELIPSYRIAKEFIDKVAKERPTKIGKSADTFRDAMKNKVETMRWREIQQRARHPPLKEP